MMTIDGAATPAIYGIIVGTFAYNYFNYFCLTWLPAYFADQWGLHNTAQSVAGSLVSGKDDYGKECNTPDNPHHDADLQSSWAHEQQPTRFRSGSGL